MKSVGRIYSYGMVQGINGISTGKNENVFREYYFLRPRKVWSGTGGFLKGSIRHSKTELKYGKYF